MLRTSVGVQTQPAHLEREAGGSDAATQHEEQPVAAAAPSTACPTADGRVKQLEQIDRPSDCSHPCLHCMGSPLFTSCMDAGCHACPSVQRDPSPQGDC